jgi:hypothetical protein
MATVLQLFNKQKKTLYGKSDDIRIQTRGLINPPRGAALLLASPTPLGDLIGGQIAGAIGGSANRPSDTIFKDNSFFAKPISLFKSPEALRNAVQPDTDYFVKKSPAPESLITKINREGSLGGALKQIGFNAIKGAKDRNPTRTNPYGAKFQTDAVGKNPIVKTKTFSQVSRGEAHYQQYYKDVNSHTGRTEYLAGEVKPRVNTKSTNFDIINANILRILSDREKVDNERYKSFLLLNEKSQTPFVAFKIYNKDEVILLPGTISSISEENSPEWNSFKYVGSPFNLYRYGGVERSISFELKMYYTDNEEKTSMKRSLSKLRELVYPSDVATITYNGTDKKNSPILYNPNLAYLTINGLYENLLGVVDSLSISIEDGTSWATHIGDTQDGYMDGSSEKPYPTVINVSIGMKIINLPEVKDNKYQYQF